MTSGKHWCFGWNRSNILNNFKVRCLASLFASQPFLTCRWSTTRKTAPPKRACTTNPCQGRRGRWRLWDGDWRGYKIDEIRDEWSWNWRMFREFWHYLMVQHQTLSFSLASLVKVTPIWIQREMLDTQNIGALERGCWTSWQFTMRCFKFMRSPLSIREIVTHMVQILSWDKQSTGQQHGSTSLLLETLHSFTIMSREFDTSFGTSRQRTCSPVSYYNIL